MDRTAPTGSSRVACGSRESGIEVQRADEGGDEQRHVDPEDRRPREAAHQRAADDRSEGDAGAAGGGPCAMALARSRGSPNTLTRIDSVVGMMQRAAEAHDAAAGDEHGGRAGGRGDDRAAEEGRQAGEQCVPAAEPVAEAAGGEQQPGEHDGVGGDDPLQLGRAGAEVVDQAGDGDVDDGVVDGGDDQGEHEHAEDAPPVGVAGMARRRLGWWDGRA